MVSRHLNICIEKTNACENRKLSHREAEQLHRLVIYAAVII